MQNEALGGESKERVREYSQKEIEMKMALQNHIIARKLDAMNAGDAEAIPLITEESGDFNQFVTGLLESEDGQRQLDRWMDELEESGESPDLIRSWGVYKESQQETLH